MEDEGPLGLYLHIPFCQSICNYCNFNRGLLDESLKARYVSALETEIVRAADGSAADSIYFGGGTPSLLTASEVSRLISACRQSFDVPATAEVTLETNPDTVTDRAARGWADAGVTRVSLGVQSFRDEELERLGRTHTAARACEAIGQIRHVNCDVSVDLMLWLPIQTREDCAASAETLVALEPDHASIYMLELYPNAPLRDEMARAGWSLAPDEDAAAMYLDTLDRMDAGGYEHYEISNVARTGKQSRHNLKYWTDGAWLGFGCGAHSTRGGARWSNVSETESYVALVAKGRSPERERQALDPERRLGDALFTGLRLVDGVDLERVNRRYDTDVMARYRDQLEPYLGEGLLVEGSGRLRLTRSGMLVANEVMRTFV